MKIIETKEIMENGVSYIVETYDNGYVIKKLKPSDIPVEPMIPEPTEDPIMEKLNNIESKIQTNEDLQTFYDDIVKEVGL